MARIGQTKLREQEKWKILRRKLRQRSCWILVRFGAQSPKMDWRESETGTWASRLRPETPFSVQS